MPQIPKTPEASEKFEISEKEFKMLKGLVVTINGMGLRDFLIYAKSPWRMMGRNFLAGMARWLGTLVWASIVIWLIGWFISTLIDIPLIGAKMEPYLLRAKHEFSRFTEANNYKPNFERMEDILKDIRTELKKPDSLKK